MTHPTFFSSSDNYEAVKQLLLTAHQKSLPSLQQAKTIAEWIKVQLVEIGLKDNCRADILFKFGHNDFSESDREKILVTNKILIELNKFPNLSDFNSTQSKNIIEPYKQFKAQFNNILYELGNTISQMRFISTTSTSNHISIISSFKNELEKMLMQLDDKVSNTCINNHTPTSQLQAVKPDERTPTYWGWVFKK